MTFFRENDEVVSRFDSGFGTAGARSLTFVDMNGDGVLDAVGSFDMVSYFRGSEYRTGVWFGRAGEGFDAFDELGASFGASAVAVADLDGDGILDIVSAGISAHGSGQASVTVFLGNGDGTFRAGVEHALSGSSPSGLAIGDLNGDGIPDLAVTVPGRSAWMLFGRGNGDFDPAIELPESGSATFVSIGDIDANGHEDLVLGRWEGRVTVLFNFGPARFDARVDFASGGPTASLVIADVDEDGDLDVVTGNEDGRITVLRNSRLEKGQV
jgi:hypothetical protein